MDILYYHQTSALVKIADGVIMWAAARLIVTASSRLKRTASPAKAVVTIFIDTAACACFRACVVVITNRWLLYRRGRRWAGIWRVGTVVHRRRRFNGNSTFPSGDIGHVPLKPDVAILSPTWSPWVPHGPVIYSIFSTISNSNNTMV